MSDAIKLKVLPQFPSRLTGRAGIDVTKVSGEYFLDLDYSDFPVISAVPAGATYALIFDPATGRYAQLPISLLGGGAAPATATPLVESGTGSVGLSVKYAREDHVHPAFGGGGGISDAPNDGTSYGRKSLAWAKVLDPVNNLADVQDTAASYRNLGGLDLSTVVNLTAASTLTTAAFGKLHFITGTAAFTTTLPTPVGNAGKMFAFLVGNAANATKLFTLTTPAGAIGRSGASIIMWANESVLLRSNGTDWDVLQSKQIPFAGTFTKSTNQSITTGPTFQNVTFDSASGDPAGLNLAFASNVFTAPRKSVYVFTAYVYMTVSGGPTYCQCQFSFNFASMANLGSFASATLTNFGQALINAGSTATIQVRSDGVPTVAGATLPSYLNFNEVAPSW
ncbi:MULTISPECIES: hypothetical protein [Bradyrhizobium]|uniref:Uncharacterized protein n=1 Tax=Bradyrhizobium barranii subsp. barranii TaxID=2823807 RepID=A0A9X9YAV7_9BRAD|nr:MULTISPECIES: hypothetical protein [Bradyrhizobium]MDI2076042.1 hypothetical protein [Bradyrhizobium sp. Mp27]UEM17051.1 hypothetical protein J4G43_024175 [Bradyrhizobium barranii subsp. barranii]